jgi:predicted O-methyltransferase YrrM
MTKPDYLRRTGFTTEASWTPATHWQMRPEWWHADDNQATEHEVTRLVAAFVTALQPQYVVETGTNSGQTALAIGRALKENGHGHLDTLETDAELAKAAKEKLHGLPVTVLNQSSMNFHPGQAIDFAWLDSETYLRVGEFNLFQPFMHEGTIVGMHDTAPHHGVYGDLVDQLPGTRSIRLHTPRGVTFLQLVG